jgi:hypothetical protein
MTAESPKGGFMDNTNNVLYENLALQLLTILEDSAVENLRLKTFIRGLRLAQEPGFSLDNLLQENALTGDNERDLRARYTEARARLVVTSDDQEGLKQFLRELEALKRLG